MATKRKMWRVIQVSALLIVIAGLASGAALGYWSTASPEKTCLSCHEISDAYESWTESSHRLIECKFCHGTALSGGLHSLAEKGRMVLGHVRGMEADNIGVGEAERLDIMDRCKSCHERDYADWIAGGHSLGYADVFLNETHNREEQIAGGCLKCHGMFFEGEVADIVAPLDIQGPWTLRDAALGPRPAIPCFACHQFHAPGTIAVRPDYANPKRIGAARESRAPRVGFYYRWEDLFLPAEALPELQLWEGDREVLVSHDGRQRVCIQCHAPDTYHQAGTSDDRTPRGVHEGLSCLACHEAHSHETAASCDACHPGVSNCGLDVKGMDTTFKNPDSGNNIHFVQCADCHEPDFLTAQGRMDP